MSVISNAELKALGFRFTASGAVVPESLEANLAALGQDAPKGEVLTWLYGLLDVVFGSHYCREESHGTMTTLNRNGPMSHNKRARLDLSRRRIPRFLFRGFTDHSGGGMAGLNSLQGIKPHAILNNTCHESFYDINEQALAAMIQGHLHGEHVTTKFSSWAAGLDIAVAFAQRRGAKDPSSIHIAVIDTKKLLVNSQQLEIFHVPQLWRAGLVSSGCTYPHEYLAHGEISGEGFYCAKLNDLQRFGLDNFYSAGRVERVTPTMVSKAKAVARTFCGDHESLQEMRIYLIAALLGMRYKHSTWQPEDYEVIWGSLNRLRSIRIPVSLRQEEGIQLDIVYTIDYPAIKQMILLLRVLVNGL